MQTDWTRPTSLAALAVVIVVVLGGCAPSVPGPSSSTASASAEPAGSAPSGATATRVEPSSPRPTPSPTFTTGFAFGADAVLGFYEQEGFTCGDPGPSPDAEGWTVQACTKRDDAGRQLRVAVVRDSEGRLGDGFASVTAADGEDFLNPEDALDHLSGFLGAMLGEERASGLLEWLAGSMGNPREEATVEDLRVSSYLRPDDDPRTIWLEVAGPDYLAAAGP
jgi:hypothetical protein